MKLIEFDASSYRGGLRLFVRRLALPAACVLAMVQGSMSVAGEPFDGLWIRTETLARENQGLKCRLGQGTESVPIAADAPPALAQ